VELILPRFKVKAQTKGHQQGDHIFRPKRDLFALGSYMNITEVAHIFGTLCSMVKFAYVLIWTQNGFGLHFGRNFHKLIWSPWPTTVFRVLHIRMFSDKTMTKLTSRQIVK
jgi:hypothetical protein